MYMCGVHVHVYAYMYVINGDYTCLRLSMKHCSNMMYNKDSVIPDVVNIKADTCTAFSTFFNCTCTLLSVIKPGDSG